jgi:hypothetical protein
VAVAVAANARERLCRSRGNGSATDEAARSATGR